MGTVILVRNFVENLVEAGFRGRAACSALLLALTIVSTSCGSAGSGPGGTASAPTATLTAAPLTIAAGQNAMLTFSSTNADSGTINNGVGLVGTNNSAGIAVSPVQTTTYTFTATGPGGSATAQATVTVDAAPTVSISASPTAIDPGNPTTLTVVASNDSQVVVTDDIGDPPYTFPSPSGGTQSFTPRVSAHYTATATGVNGDIDTNTVLVTVLPPASPTVTLTASPAAVIAGGSTTLTWTSANTSSVVINASTGTSPGGVQPVAGGSVSTPALSATTTYTATANGANGTTPATATVTVAVDAITSFEGMDYSQVANGSTQTDIDPSGAVGTKQFMEYVNSAYQAYDKVTQAPVWSSPQPIGTPWGSDEHCGGGKIQLDAVILFDRLASRWVIAAKTTVEDHFYFCIAVSSTDDLTSNSLTWYIDGWDITDELGVNSEGDAYLPDWPKLGTWPDAYYATMDLNDPDNGDAQSGVVACALDRTDLLTNGPTINSPICLPSKGVQNPANFSNGVFLAHSLIPADVDGTTAPPVGRDEFMVSIENPVNDGSTTTSTTFNLWDFHVDWGTPADSTFTQSTISVPVYTPGCYLYAPGNPTITNCVPEPGVTGVGGQRVDSVGDRMMPRFAYRNFGSYESFLISQTVQTNMGVGQDATQTGILWYELRGSGTPTVYQQGLISPDSTYYRFLPSIAQDHVGNAAVGYSLSNTFTNPGIDVSYWSLTGSTPPTEITTLNGPGEEVTASGVGHWGTYSSMTVDPVDDCAFWYVNEYWFPTDSNPADDQWSTNISYFQLPGCN